MRKAWEEEMKIILGLALIMATQAFAYYPYQHRYYNYRCYPYHHCHRHHGEYR